MSGSKPRSGLSNGRKTAWEESLGRITSKLECLLAKRKYAAGDDFTIADIVHFGWLWRREFAGIDFDGTPNIARWYSEIAGRPSVHRAIERVNHGSAVEPRKRPASRDYPLILTHRS
jgi:glutathione S-transferase